MNKDDRRTLNNRKFRVFFLGQNPDWVDGRPIKDRELKYAELFLLNEYCHDTFIDDFDILNNKPEEIRHCTYNMVWKMSNVVKDEIDTNIAYLSSYLDDIDYKKNNLRDDSYLSSLGELVDKIKINIERIKKLKKDFLYYQHGLSKILGECSVCGIVIKGLYDICSSCEKETWHDRSSNVDNRDICGGSTTVDRDKE